MDQKLENFQKTCKLLIENKIFFWLDQGTLLGCIRDNRLIEWDTDIDLSMWPEDFDKAKTLSNEFQKIGFYFDLQDNKDAIYLSDGNQHFIEIARLHKDLKNNIVYRRNSQQNGQIGKFIKKTLTLLPRKIHLKLKSIARNPIFGKKIIACTPAEFFNGFRTIDFLGVDKVFIPEKTIEYLEFKYGKNWKTPQKDWNYLKHDGSIAFSKAQLRHDVILTRDGDS